MTHPINSGWYPDPMDPTNTRLRRFDGVGWTSETQFVQGSKIYTDAPAPLAHNRVDPNSAQAVFLKTWKVIRPVFFARHIGAESGWYPDPLSEWRQLRFFDGKTWTLRTRPHPKKIKSLPSAARGLQQRVVATMDNAARGEKVFGIFPKIAWSAPDKYGVTSIAPPTRAGQIGAQISMVLIILSIGLALTGAWQTWGTGLAQENAQRGLESQLEKDFESLGGDSGIQVGSDPTPIDVTTAEPTQKPDEPRKPAPRPELNTQPADIAPFPPAGWTAPADRKVRKVEEFSTGKAVGRIIIPRLGLDEVMVMGTGPDELGKGPGIWQWGALPGNPGNATIAGHRTGWGEPFRHLDRLRYGDQIIIEIPGQARSVYEIRGQAITTPFDVQVTRHTQGNRLTLTTCTPVSVNTHRLIYQAEMIEGPWLDQSINRSKWYMAK